MIGLYNVIISLASIFVFMFIMFIVAIIVKDNGIIDICWSLNFILATVVSFCITIIYWKTIDVTQIVLTALILIWGLRLSYHIGKRNIGKGEDKRYKERRESWGKNFYVKTFFLIFMLQALWAAIIISPVVVSNAIYPEIIQYPLPSFSYLTGVEYIPLIIGFLIWCIGFYFEVIGDRQLKQFIRNPDNKGKVIESGLWKYTRHPNYFGEITMSWGLFVITISFAISHPLLWITIIGPIMYTLLIRYVTGVPEVEKHLITKPGYSEYMKRTSVLFPLKPKKENVEK